MFKRNFSMIQYNQKYDKKKMSQQNFPEVKARKTPTSFIQTVKNRKS